MKIGVDISQTCENKSGTGFFADQLVRALAEVDKENTYTLFPHFYDYRPRETKMATKINEKNFKNKLISDFSDQSEEIAKLDIIHSNNFRFPKNTRAKKVVTIYDVCFMEYPEYTTEANRLFCYQGTLESMLYADKIIAISEYTKKKLFHFFPFINETKIEVVYCGNRDTLLNFEEDYNCISQYGIDSNEYFLAVGTIEPRKNYETLLKAFKRYKDNVNTYKKLCIAGGYGWLEENFQEKIKDLGLENDVVVTGYVSEEVLSNLYRHCFAFVYPTWYEGFGLPVLEAMSFKKPVISSNVSSIPEITGNSALLIQPESFEQIAECMKKLGEDSALYQRLTKEGFERSNKFTWQSTAKRMLDIYEKIM